MLLQMAGFHSFSKLSSSPSLCVVCVRARSPHIFLLLSAYGRLGCLHILAAVNSAVMNTGVPVSFPISVFVLL